MSTHSHSQHKERSNESKPATTTSVSTTAIPPQQQERQPQQQLPKDEKRRASQQQQLDVKEKLEKQPPVSTYLPRPEDHVAANRWDKTVGSSGYPQLGTSASTTAVASACAAPSIQRLAKRLPEEQAQYEQQQQQQHQQSQIGRSISESKTDDATPAEDIAVPTTLDRTASLPGAFRVQSSGFMERPEPRNHLYPQLSQGDSNSDSDGADDDNRHQDPLASDAAPEAAPTSLTTATSSMEQPPPPTTLLTTTTSSYTAASEYAQHQSINGEFLVSASLVEGTERQDDDDDDDRRESSSRRRSNRNVIKAEPVRWSPSRCQFRSLVLLLFVLLAAALLLGIGLSRQGDASPVVIVNNSSSSSNDTDTDAGVQNGNNGGNGGGGNGGGDDVDVECAPEEFRINSDCLAYGESRRVRTVHFATWGPIVGGDNNEVNNGGLIMVNNTDVLDRVWDGVSGENSNSSSSSPQAVVNITCGAGQGVIDIVYSDQAHCTEPSSVFLDGRQGFVLCEALDEPSGGVLPQGVASVLYTCATDIIAPEHLVGKVTLQELPEVDPIDDPIADNMYQTAFLSAGVFCRIHAPNLLPYTMGTCNEGNPIVPVPSANGTTVDGAPHVTYCWDSRASADVFGTPGDMLASLAIDSVHPDGIKTVIEMCRIRVDMSRFEAPVDELIESQLAMQAWKKETGS